MKLMSTLDIQLTPQVINRIDFYFMHLLSTTLSKLGNLWGLEQLIDH